LENAFIFRFTLKCWNNKGYINLGFVGEEKKKSGGGETDAWENPFTSKGSGKKIKGEI